MELGTRTLVAVIHELTEQLAGIDKIYARRRILITGHTGFKGSWLTFWLTRLGAEVTGFSLPPTTDPSLFRALGLEKQVTHIEGDVRDLDALRTAWQDAKPELVLHLAAQSLVTESYRDPLGTVATNVIGTTNLLELARTSNAPEGMLLVTSDKCYENNESSHPYSETDPMGGHDVYSMTKGAAELVISSYRRSFFAKGGSDADVAIASARAGNVIGGGDWAPERLVPDCIRALRSGETVKLRNPDAVRPWQHVLEPLSGYLGLGARLLSSDRSTRRQASEAWNFGPAEENTSSVRELVESIIDAWGGGSWRAESSAADFHEAATLRLSIEKAAKLLHWHPRWNLQKTVELTVGWYRAFYAGDDMTAWCASQIDEYSRA